MHQRPWEPLIRHEEASALIAPLLVLGADDPEHPPFGGPPPPRGGVGGRPRAGPAPPAPPPCGGRPLPRAEMERPQAHGADIIAGCVMGICAFWRQRRR